MKYDKIYKSVDPRIEQLKEMAKKNVIAINCIRQRLGGEGENADYIYVLYQTGSGDAMIKRYGRHGSVTPVRSDIASFPDMNKRMDALIELIDESDSADASKPFARIDTINTTQTDPFGIKWFFKETTIIRKDMLDRVIPGIVGMTDLPNLVYIGSPHDFLEKNKGISIEGGSIITDSTEISVGILDLGSYTITDDEFMKVRNCSVLLRSINDTVRGNAKDSNDFLIDIVSQLRGAIPDDRLAMTLLNIKSRI